MHPAGIRLRLALAPMVLLVPAVAAASASYPPEVQTRWNVELPPPNGCQLCHRDEEGRAGTATQYFARTLINEYGLVGGSNVPALRSVLQQARADATDSDDDGTADYDELVAGTDPNVFDEVDVIDGGSGAEGGAGGSSAVDGPGSGGRPVVTRPPPPSPPASYPALENGCAVSNGAHGSGPGQEPCSAGLLVATLCLALLRRRLTFRAE